MSVYPADATQNSNVIIENNNLASKSVQLNAAQTKIRYENDDGTIRDRLSFIPADTFATSWSPGVIADGDSVFIDITVTGIVLGWIASASFDKALLGGTLSANVEAVNTVRVTIANHTGGNIVPATGDVRVLVTAT